MIPMNAESILQYVKGNGLPDASIDKDTQQIISRVKVDGAEFPVFFRVFDGANLLQCLVFMPFQLDPKGADGTARLLHLINKEIDLPGFGMDEESGAIYFRHMIPSHSKQCDPQLLKMIIDGMQLVCGSFAGAIAAVASGDVPFSEIVERSKKPQQ